MNVGLLCDKRGKENRT